jgi:hypothetical protein
MRWMLIGLLVLAGCGGSVCENGVVSNQDFALIDGGLAVKVDADAGCPAAR